MRPDEFEKANVRFTCCPPSREWLLSIPAKGYLTHELTPVHLLVRRNRIRRQRDEEMSLDIYDIRRAVRGYYNGLNDSGLDEWMKSHDAEVRNEAIIARDTRTPADLIQAAWDAAYPVPEGRTIPAGTPNVMKYKDGTIMWNVMGSTYEIEFIETDRIRTMEPLPPLIPDDCNAVWASTRDDESRRVWVRTTRSMPDLVEVWDDGNTDADFAEGTDLINPVPIPEEGNR